MAQSGPWLYCCSVLQAMLNRCFDEVEKFVLRLKQSGKAFQELSKRKHSKNGRRFGGEARGVGDPGAAVPKETCHNNNYRNNYRKR